VTKERKYLFIGFLIAAFFCGATSFGQESIGTYQVRVSLDRASWSYELNETPKATVAVTLNNSQVAGLPLKVSCGPEMMPPLFERTVTTTAVPLTIDAGTMKSPGFLRCIATVEKDGRTYRGLATAAFKPDLIKPIVAEPADFDKFWKEGLDRLAKITVEPRLEHLPGSSTAKADVYHVSFQTVGSGLSLTSRIYGILAVPKGPADRKYPALLRVPGAGVRQYNGNIPMAEAGMITLDIGIHGIPVTQPQWFYDNLRDSALNRYMLYNMDDREAYYYRRVFLSVVRANDFLVSLPQYDGQNLGVIGGSQGGVLAIVTAALDQRVKAMAVSYPAMSDMIGYTAERAGGWPHQFRDTKNRTKEKLETAAYYDTVNFARRVKIPGIYSWGFNDEVCPPTSIYAAYNVISAPKRVVLGVEMGHGNAAEQTARLNEWIERSLKGGR
jgi:cephalosporin-C deacetylase-like acetyl esterase